VEVEAKRQGALIKVDPRMARPSKHHCCIAPSMDWVAHASLLDPILQLYSKLVLMRRKRYGSVFEHPERATFQYFKPLMDAFFSPKGDSGRCTK
jgi:hypothetical protein